MFCEVERDLIKKLIEENKVLRAENQKLKEENKRLKNKDKKSCRSDLTDFSKNFFVNEAENDKSNDDLQELIETDELTDNEFFKLIENQIFD